MPRPFGLGLGARRGVLEVSLEGSRRDDQRWSVVLSIGKIGMARAQQLYYEQQVAAGREDYYAGKGEAPGRWLGSGANALGLSGALDPERLTAMFDGKHPETGERLAVRSGRSSTAGVDMTFSAPKSVSVLFALGDEDLSRALVGAHEEAVEAAVAYMEMEACRVRRGHNGTKAERDAGDPRGWEQARSERAGGFVAAAYRHRMSRAQDPQLHTHVVAANMARGADGRWTALDAKHIYAHAKAGGSVYQAHLRQAVRERLSWAAWGPVKNGMAELEQVPPGVLEEFSTRRRRILERERQLVGDGVAIGDAGRARVTLDTREPKRQVVEADWIASVRARAEEHGLGADQLSRLAELEPAAEASPIEQASLAAASFSPAGLTATVNTFRERDVVIAAAAAHRHGIRAMQLTGVARELLDDERVVAIPDRLDRRFSTRELVGAEERILTHAARGRGQRAGILNVDRVERALNALERPLTGEQAGVLRAIVRSGNRVDTVEALAGTGKTTTAHALREAYEREGYRVLGAAPTGRAVRELSERAGIRDARTLDGWAVKLDADPLAFHFARAGAVGVRRVPAVLIIDEAGMAHTRLCARVIDAAIDARVKVIAIGDSGQLSSVQAGGWLGAITRRLGSHELREVMRQHDPRERKALARLHRGQPDEYLELKSGRDELRVFAGEHPGLDAERAAIELWAQARDEYGEDQAVLICRDNLRRERLNQAAREHLRQHGELGETILIGGREWSVGDRVIARRNDRGRDLDNGMRGTITAADQRGLTIQIDNGQRRQLDPEYAARHLEHAYCMTGHGMQGGTVQWAAVVGQPGDFTRNWSYTALSRARHPTQLLLIDEPAPAQVEREEIAPAPEPQPTLTALDRVGSRMRERDDEDLALEQLEATELRAPKPMLETAAPTLEPAEGRERDHPRPTANQITLPEPEPGAAPAVARSARQELAAVRAELDQVRDALGDPIIAAARELADTRTNIQSILAQAQHDQSARGRRERQARQHRAQQRERRLAELTDRQQRLTEVVGDPDPVLEHEAILREHQSQLLRDDGQLQHQAVNEELDQNPPWLNQTLGPEPDDPTLKQHWDKTARQIAAHRINHDITDPTDPGIRSSDHLLNRSISTARAHLGLELPSPELGSGHDLA